MPLILPSHPQLTAMVAAGSKRVEVRRAKGVFWEQAYPRFCDILLARASHRYSRGKELDSTS